METYDSTLLKITKKKKIDLSSFTYRGSSRDFRIQKNNNQMEENKSIHKIEKIIEVAEVDNNNGENENDNEEDNDDNNNDSSDKEENDNDEETEDDDVPLSSLSKKRKLY